MATLWKNGKKWFIWGLTFKVQKTTLQSHDSYSTQKKIMKCDLHPVFTSRKVADEIKVTEPKPPLLNKQCVVYEYKCDLCDAGYRWVIHAEAYFSAFMNISILSLVNTCGTYKI